MIQVNTVRVLRMLNIFKFRIIELMNPVEAARMKNVHFGNGLKIYGHIKWGSEPWIITLGNNVHLTDGVRFVTHDGGTLILRDRIPDLEITKPITIGNNVYVGVDSIILPGVTIGNNVVIGARSVVTRDIPDDSVAVGQPARVIKSIDDYLTKIEKESLHLGHLSAKEKDSALREYYSEVLKEIRK